MAIKDYIAIDPATNLVVLLTSCEEADVAALYPSYTIVEAAVGQANVRKAFPGMLYAGGEFWIAKNANLGATGFIKNQHLTKLEFRRLFTNDELVKSDNFEADLSLPPEARAQLKTLTTSLALSTTINLEDPLTVLGLSFLVSIGYLSESRKTAILAGEAP